MAIMDTGLPANRKCSFQKIILLYCNLCLKKEKSITVTTENALTHKIGNSCDLVIYKGDWMGFQMSQCTSVTTLSKLKNLR